MKYFFILIFLFTFTNNLNVRVSQSNSNETKVYCTGNAQTSLKTNRLKINLKIETNNTDRTESLKKNIKISKSVISALTNIGLQNDDFETTSFSIYAQYRSVFNNVTQRWDSIFNGYKTSNQILIQTLDLKNAGKFLDAIAINGGSISSINFDATENVAKEEKLKLLSIGMEDCKLQLEKLVKLIGYSIQKYTSINIENIGTTIVPTKSFSDTFQSDSSSRAVEVFSGKQNLGIRIKVGALIKRI